MATPKQIETLASELSKLNPNAQEQVPNQLEKLAWELSLLNENERIECFHLFVGFLSKREKRKQKGKQ